MWRYEALLKKGKDRVLFEMATGTGKTLTSAAVIRLFLRTGNARRVLFLVGRLELEDQAWKVFTRYLKPDFSTLIYIENKSDWHKADIAVTITSGFCLSFITSENFGFAYARQLSSKALVNPHLQ